MGRMRDRKATAQAGDHTARATRRVGGGISGLGCRGGRGLAPWLAGPLLGLILAAIAVGGFGAEPAGSTTGQPAGAKAEIANQLANVGRLLEHSSGARRIAASDDELVRKIHAYAAERHAAAAEAFRAGDYEAARTLLAEATQSMVMAVRMLGEAPEITDKRDTDFDARLETTRVLLDALRRISADEDADGVASTKVAELERAVSAALELREAGEPEKARRVLDGAYELVKLAVEALRDGRTLVRTLEFGSDEEEYRYELDRNDTHQMLVRVLLNNKDAGADTRAAVNGIVERANALRQQAEEESADGEFRAAIELLEQSTRELVRAIRRAGLYIPG